MFVLIAQRINNTALGSFGNQTGESFLSKLLPALISAMLVVGVVVFLFVFLSGAIAWITSGGDKGKLEGAKQTLSNALIGLTLLLGFYAIVSLIECFFGIGLRQIDIGPYNISLTGSNLCKGSGGNTQSGNTMGNQIGNPLCRDCTTNACGITGQVYNFAGNVYRCTSASGWTITNDPVTSTVCGTCP